MRRLLAILALGSLASIGHSLPANAATASPSTYYVDCHSKSGGDGTAAHPWNALATVNSHASFAPGDRLLFARGTACKGQLHPAGSGTNARPIVVGAYGKGAKPMISSGGTADRSATVELNDQSYWTIQDLAITNWTGSRNALAYRSGVRVTNDSKTAVTGIVLQRLTVTKVSSTMRSNYADPREWGGISLIGYSAGSFKNVKVLSNRIDHVGRTGIMFANHSKSYATGLRISGNYVSWTRGDGIVIRGATGARIDHNRVKSASDEWPCPECGRITPQTANAAIWAAISKNTLIDHNEAWDTKAKGGDGEGFDVDASAVGTVLEYNYSHDNAGGGVLFCGSVNTTVRFNILENNQKSALTFIGSMPARNTSIYNNTIYISAKTKARPVGYFNGPHGSTISFKNNLVYNYGFASWMWPAKHVTSANTLIGLHSTGRPADSRTSYSTPGLKNPGSGGTGMGTLKGYKPSHPSSFKTGVAIPKSVTRDFFGKKINPKHPPRGAAG